MVLCSLFIRLTVLGAYISHEQTKIVLCPIPHESTTFPWSHYNVESPEHRHTTLDSKYPLIIKVIAHIHIVLLMHLQNYVCTYVCERRLYDKCTYYVRTYVCEKGCISAGTQVQWRNCDYVSALWCSNFEEDMFSFS